jgi:hypothetical protein
MKHITLFFLTFVLFLSSISLSYSALSDYGFEENKHQIKITDPGIIYAGQKLRGILDYYSKLDLSKQENRKLIDEISTNQVKNIEEYLKLFKEKFIITRITRYKHKDHFCKNNAYDFNIAIKPEEIESLSITITDDNKICEIMDHDIKNIRYRYEDISENYKNYGL